MLIISLVVKIPAVLFYCIDSELRRINLFSSETIIFQFSINGSLFLSIGILNPNAVIVKY